MQEDSALKFYGLDGDKIGSVVEAYLVKGDMNALSTFSRNVSIALEAIRADVLQKKGYVVFCAGDSILFQGEFDTEWCKHLLNIFVATTGRTASLGIGETMMASYLALKLAKAMGGGIVLHLPPLDLPDRL
jgi:hypothetical protein